MKLLANIFLSGLAILACVSCSKDEDPVLPLEGAKLSVAVKASGTATKAYNPNDVNELEGEAYINNLAVVVLMRPVRNCSVINGRLFPGRNIPP